MLVACKTFFLKNSRQMKIYIYCRLNRTMILSLLFGEKSRQIDHIGLWTHRNVTLVVEDAYVRDGKLQREMLETIRYQCMHSCRPKIRKIFIFNQSSCISLLKDQEFCEVDEWNLHRDTSTECRRGG